MQKTWTVSRGPIAATEADVAKAAAISALLTSPVGVLPQKPGDPIRPFAVGLFNEIRQRLKPEFGVTTLRKATAFYIYSKRYYFASAQPDSMRHDINGKAVAPLSEEDRAAAQKSFVMVKRHLSGLDVPERPNAKRIRREMRTGH